MPGVQGIYVTGVDKLPARCGWQIIDVVQVEESRCQIMILVAGHSSAPSGNCRLWIVSLKDLCATQCRMQQSSPGKTTPFVRARTWSCVPLCGDIQFVLCLVFHLLLEL